MRLIFLILPILFSTSTVYSQQSASKGQLRQGLSMPYIEYGSAKNQWTTPFPIAAFPIGYSYKLGSSVFFDLESLYIWNFSQSSEVIVQPGAGINLPGNLVIDTRLGYRFLVERSFFHSLSANKIIPIKSSPVFLVTGVAIINNLFPPNISMDSFQLLGYVLIGITIN